MRSPLVAAVVAFCALLVTPVARADDPKIVAVLPFADESKIDSILKSTLEEAIRTAAGDALSAYGYTVLTGETTLQVLADNGIDSAKACDTTCHLETARNLKARYFISGTMVKAEGAYIAFIRLFDAKTGRQFGSAQLEGETVRALRKQFEEKASKFFERVGGQMGETSPAPAPTPAPAPAPTPAPAPYNPFVTTPAPAPAPVAPAPAPVAEPAPSGVISRPASPKQPGGPMEGFGIRASIISASGLGGLELSWNKYLVGGSITLGAFPGASVDFYPMGRGKLFFSAGLVLPALFLSPADVSEIVVVNGVAGWDILLADHWSIKLGIGAAAFISSIETAPSIWGSIGGGYVF